MFNDDIYVTVSLFCYALYIPKPPPPPPVEKIRHIEGNAKSRHLKKKTCKGTLRQVFICRSRTTSPPPLLTHYIRVYSILIHTGKGGGGRIEPERRGEGKQGRVQNTQLGWKYQPDWMYKMINTRRKVPLQVTLFRWRHFAMTSMSLIFLGTPPPTFQDFLFRARPVGIFCKRSEPFHVFHQANLEDRVLNPPTHVKSDDITWSVHVTCVHVHMWH